VYDVDGIEIYDKEREYEVDGIEIYDKERESTMLMA
jgi:hypothetical protein